MVLRLKPFLPRGLFGRAALILVLPIVVLQLVVAATFIQRHFEGVTRQMSEGIAIEIRHLLAEVAAAPDLAAAQGRAADLGGALDLVVSLPGGPPAAADARAFWDWSGRVVIQTLRARLPEMEVADLLTNTRQVRAWFRTPWGEMRIEVDRRRVSASNPHQLLVLMVLASVVMTAVAFVFLRNQMTPIARLAKAAEAFGKGQVVPYRPRGALEVRAAGHAFLDMRARIERQIEARTMMLSGVSHDLRTPLTRMKLALSLMPEDDETEALAQDVAQMERMVNEFLAFARGDAMEEAVPVDPAALVTGVVEAAARAGQPVTLGAVDWPVVGGPSLLRLRPDALARALENLIGNAVRHGTRAEVSLITRERMLRFVVEDDGPGIPREQRDEAMQPFRRLDSARNPNSGGGVGLGLAIAADIASSHGGALRLGESERLGGLRAELSVVR
ncbi:ATP-binding protein [Tabrizicola fusiformis]|uniref:ATP-binding protein n=1 Tax=Tabrizicola sp. SY72 TaxID=2741673 RepID=UPI0015735B41|nr:ATP-binding protein [Tabrizicola sp. SY72]NTT85721.1 two-component sensor histidine kinase [Tabrizicola sp. SY72]